MKRLLECYASDLERMSKEEKLGAIAASEGRILCNECTCMFNRPLIDYVSDPEVKSALGVDMILMNALDVNHPHIPGLPAGTKEDDSIRLLKKMTGRLFGVNLEPVDPNVSSISQIESIPTGRQANAATAKRAADLGFDYILLTGNPGTGVTNKEILRMLKEIKEAVGDRVILMAGKMHCAGSRTDTAKNILTKELIKDFADAGADVICMPAPGTVPGIDQAYVTSLVEYAHELGLLTMTTIGTSQEGARRQTIEQIALMCKMCGTDIHHVGDANVQAFDNLLYYGYSIRGFRHTIGSMAKSPIR